MTELNAKYIPRYYCEDHSMVFRFPLTPTNSTKDIVLCYQFLFVIQTNTELYTQRITQSKIILQATWEMMNIINF